MTRIIRKMRPQRWRLVVGPAIIMVPYIVYILLISAKDLEQAQGIMTILWFGLGFFVRYVLAVLLVTFVILYLLRAHHGVSTVSFLTYVDNTLYSKFNSITSGVNFEERIFWEAQRNMAISKRDRASQSAVTEKSDNLSSTFTPEAASEKRISSDAIIDDVTGESGSDSEDRSESADPLADLPEFDPTGPRPFG